MTDKHIETPHPTAPPSYERLLEEQYGADSVARSRAEAQATPGLGEPRAALGFGEVAPSFSLPDANGARVDLASLLANGPVVLIFYRGGWCPFCNMYLRAFQLARPHLRALGAQVVLISPELAAHGRTLAERHSLLFPVLSDSGNQVAREYRLVFRMPTELRAEYLADGVDLAEHNGDTSWEVPMPATFVITPDGRICYAFVSDDYTQRAEPKEVLGVLRRLHRPR
jgi:peroxiredoxin